MSLWKWKLDGSKKYFKCIIKGRGLVETQVNWFENKHTRASNQEHLNFLARIEKRYTYLTKSIYIFLTRYYKKTIDFDKVFLGDKNIKSIRFQRHGWGMAAEPENFKVNVSHTKQNALIGWEVCEIFHEQILREIAQPSGQHRVLVIYNPIVGGGGI